MESKSYIEDKANPCNAKRWVRNVKTDKVFEIPSMKEFCHNPAKFDADYESCKKFLTVDPNSKPTINLQQLSNAFTGYIAPPDRLLGMKQAHKVVCSGLYSPARYTLGDIEKLKDYKHKVKVLDIAKSIKYPLCLIDIVSLDEKVISSDRDVINLLSLANRDASKDQVTVSSFKTFLRSFSNVDGVIKPTSEKQQVLSIGKDFYRPKESFFKGRHWWKYNTDGSSSEICVVSKKTNETMFFTYAGLQEFSKKLRDTGTKQYIPRNKDSEHSSFGRSLRKLIDCELKTAYGLKVDDKKCDLRIRLLRFFLSPQVAYCKKAGYDVNFDMKGLSEIEKHTCEKILKLRADTYHD